jgi:DNA-binding MarR family transcriptional regulator
MDAVLFAVKRAHLGGERFGRRMLRQFGLTPARFDLMNAASGASGVTQSVLWRRLGVVRSAVCEMISALAGLGLVERRRDLLDRRTCLVRLTARGRDLFERAYAALIESGDVTVAIDRVLASHIVEIDPTAIRYEFVGRSFAIADAFSRGRASNWDPYGWNFEDFYHWFVEPEDGDVPGGIPFVRAE